MAEYKMIPVDQETYDKLVKLCEAYGRKQGAQVKTMVDVEYEKLAVVKLIGKVKGLPPSPTLPPNGGRG